MCPFSFACMDIYRCGKRVLEGEWLGESLHGRKRERGEKVNKRLLDFLFFFLFNSIQPIEKVIYGQIRNYQFCLFKV